MSDVPGTPVARGERGRWLPGQSGNPRGGKPKERTVTREIEKLLRRRIEVDGVPMSRREAIARVIVTESLAGNMTAVRLLLAYVDGPPVTPYLAALADELRELESMIGGES